MDNRLFAALDPKQFLDCFLRWTQSLRQAVPEEIVALDGKALRRALNAEQSVKYVVSAWAERNGLVLGQLKVADKSNEITALPELLRVLELAGCIVTTDAMGCQKTIAREIIAADADYILALKGNHETVHAKVRTFLDDALAEAAKPRPVGAQHSPAAHLAGLETVEKDHGRLETRRYYQSAALDWFADQAKWAGLRSVGMGGSDPGTRRETDGGTALLFVEPAVGRGDLCAGGARPLGRGKQIALGAGRLFSRGPESGARRLRGGESGDATPAGVEPVETRENQKARHQGQATQRQLGSCLLVALTRRHNLDASALGNQQSDGL